MAKPQLPAQDRAAISQTKEQRLLARIRELKKDQIYYKKWWLPSLVGGVLCFGLITIMVVYDIYIPRILMAGSPLALINGIYWFFKYYSTRKKLEELEAIWDKRMTSKAAKQ